MAYQIIGKLYSIGQTEQKTDKFSVREFVIHVEKFSKKRDESYYVKFQVINAKCDELDGRNFQDALKYGMNVRVDFEIGGFQAKDGRIWNNLKAISITPIGIQTTIDTPAEPVATYPIHQKPAYIAPNAYHEPDDLTF